MHSSKPRRWSKRSVLLVVSSLIAGVVVLVIGVVGFARSVGFVMQGAEAVGDLDQSAPERASPAHHAVTAGEPASRVTEVASSGGGSISPDASQSAVPVTAASPPVAAASPASTPAPAADSGGAAPVGGAQAGSFGGVAGVSGSGAGGIGGSSGTGGSGGAAGTTATFWQSVVQSALALIGRTTVAMCGPNTCNVGQVCCNASCGICVAPGATCDKTQCSGAPRTPTATLCGTAQCNDGQVCCNASCGICTAPGESCSDQPCQ